MAAYTDSLGFNQGTAAFPSDVTAVSKFEVKLNFADIIAARSAAGATALVAGDSMEVIKLPAGSVVLSAGCQVTTVEATNTTGTFSLGTTGGTTNLYTNALANNALAFGITNLANPVVYGTADTIDILLNTAVPTNCVVNVFAIVADVRANYVA